MKKVILFLALICLSAAGYAQYGKLEPLAPHDTSYFVLRTSPEKLADLLKSKNADDKMLSRKISSVENQLQILRSQYLTNRRSSPDINMFLKNIKWLDLKGVGTNYYIQEMLLYTKK